MSDGRRLRRPHQRTVIGHSSSVGRLALRMVLEHEDDISVDGEADDATGAGALARDLVPDFLIMQDLLLNRGHTGPLPHQTLLVILGMGDDARSAAAASSRGAAGYLCLEDAEAGLAAMLRRLSVASLN